MTTLGRHKGLLAMVLLFAFLFGGCGTAGENKFSLFNTILGNDTSAASADLSPTFSTYQDGHLYYIPLSGTSEGCLIDYDVQTGSSSRVYQSYSKNTAAEAMVSVVYHEGKIYGWIMSTTKDNAFSSNWDYVYGTLSKIDPLTYERSDYLFNDIISMLWYTGEAIYFVGRDSISANQRISLYRFDFEEETFTDILKDDTLSKQNNFDSTTECEIQRIKNGRIYFTYKSSGETHLCSVKTRWKGLYTIQIV